MNMLCALYKTSWYLINSVIQHDCHNRSGKISNQFTASVIIFKEVLGFITLVFLHISIIFHKTEEALSLYILFSYNSILIPFSAVANSSVKMAEADIYVSK